MLQSYTHREQKLGFLFKRSATCDQGIFSFHFVNHSYMYMNVNQKQTFSSDFIKVNKSNAKIWPGRRLQDPPTLAISNSPE